MIDIQSLNTEFVQILDTAIAQNATDIHMIAGVPPMVRVDTILRSIDLPAYSVEKANQMISDILGPALYAKLKEGLQEMDFSFSYSDRRFRANTYFQKGSLGLSLRLLPNAIASLKDLGVNPMAEKLIEHKQGLVIISGPTGHGKSTTLAAMIKLISERKRGHIITIEDPIEYILANSKSIISQREVGVDTSTFASALRASLREDPDVVLLGEMRDQETMETALTIAETGHLVLTTLHTNSAAQTANRIIDVFPTHKQDQVRIQLSEVLLGIISQRLLPKIQGGLVLASEVLVANAAVRSLIRDGKTHQIPNLIQTSAAEGMVGLDRSLADLVTKGVVNVEDALNWSLDPKTLKTMIY